MELPQALREELLHYHAIADFESTENDDEEWFHALCGYQAILDGEPIPDVAREAMKRELLYNEDKFEEIGLKHEYQTLLAELGFRKRRPAKPRGYELVRDLEDPDYTIPFGKNRYCGPAALAYLLRTDPDAAAALLRKISGKKKIIGTERSFMLAALGRYGFECVPRPHFRPCIKIARYRTLLGWLEEERRAPDAEYLLVAGNHYIVVHGDRWFDSFCHLGKPVTNCIHLRKRVTSAWLVRAKK